MARNVLRLHQLLFILYTVDGFRSILSHRHLVTCLSMELGPSSIFETSMERLAATNAELLAIKEERDILGKSTGGVQALTRCPLSVMNNKAATVGKLLERDGAVSIPGVLSSQTADELLAYINRESDRAKGEVSDGLVPFDTRFGGVNCRGQQGMFGLRQDMYLPMSEDIVQKAFAETVRQLAPLLLATVTADGMVHEVSSFVADPGAPRQCVHADTIVLPCPQYPLVSMEPLYTIFIALQDVDEDMGHTVFLPKTHTPEAHLLWNVDQRKKEKFLESQLVVKSGLKKGDVSIFDSRLLHCGCANSSNKRRVLAYCTVSKQQRWPLPDGLHGSNSIRVEDRWKYKVKDLL
jgi:ectoine hydroxylase-related dioxygenase (phytanoyl-CoA dioxygenase family)